MLANADINIRDPFVVTMPDEKLYYLYGTTGADTWSGKPAGFDVYVGGDLKHWEGPIPAFRPPPGFWSDRNYWAPEVHRYHGRWYMLASFKAEGVFRGTQVLVADSLRGPFVPHSDGPVTPSGWECLDGTLFVDENGQPWMVFCHEWVQVHDGEICAIPLSADLTRAAGEPILLFRASSAPWISPYAGQSDFVTDGPFLYRTRSGELLMLWSSFTHGDYALATARSGTGLVAGPWEQDPEPLFKSDGGHGMIFTRLDGELMLSLHQPNSTPNERPVFIPIQEQNGRLTQH